MYTRPAPSGPTSPITLWVVRRAEIASTRTRTRRRRPTSRPARVLIASTGIFTPGPPSEPLNGAPRSEMTSTAPAPARCASRARLRNVHTPRRASAISPRLNPS
jgi:hypothetical protein